MRMCRLHQHSLEEDLSFGGRPFFWRKTFLLEEDLSFGGRPFFWRKTFLLEEDLSFGGRPFFSVLCHVGSHGLRYRTALGGIKKSSLRF